MVIWCRVLILRSDHIKNPCVELLVKNSKVTLSLYIYFGILASVIERDILGEGITWWVFEAVLVVLAEVNTCEFGLGILDGCDLLGVLGDDEATTLGGCAPRIN